MIKDTTALVTKSVEDQARDRRDAAIRDTVLVLAAIVAALGIVLLVARSLVQPLRVLRDGALKVAHEDLEREITRVRAGDEQPPEPLPVHTTEEIGQVAHAVDELHTQALLLAGDEARLRLLVNDMFETMSRRNRSLVDQQLSLIDRLERNEEDPDRLDSLFRLDHLAARMRRNGANLLVLASAPSSRGDQRTPVPLSSVISAATSEVEDYRRVETSMVPDCTINGAAAGDVVHLIAELIDNALRYSPPASPVRVSASQRSDAAVLLEILDVGLGMTDGDRRIANMRLRAGGEVTPDSARHMGLFVVGRLADRHGIRVRLRGMSTEQARSGTTAEVYLPATLLVGADDGHVAPPETAAAARQTSRRRPITRRPRITAKLRSLLRWRRRPSATARIRPNHRSACCRGAGPDPAASPVPRPTSRIGRHGVRHRCAGEKRRPSRLLKSLKPLRLNRFQARRRSSAHGCGSLASRLAKAEPVAPEPVAPQPSAQAEPEGADETWPAEAPATSSEPPESDLIYQRMLSEWLVDPHDLARSADLDWKSVWDHGWSAAAEVENVPVQAHTDHGLPVRDPGARLVPGACRPRAERHRAAPRRRGQRSSLQRRLPVRPQTRTRGTGARPGGDPRLDE